MASCKDCIHYEPCWEYGNILDPIHGGVKCDSFKSAADVVPKSEVEALLKENDRWMTEYAGFRAGVKSIVENAKQEVAREIFELVECAFSPVLVYEGHTVKAYIAELKKKYTEGK